MSPATKCWRVQITWPGGTATHDVETDTDWKANLVAIRMPWIPQGNLGYAITMTPINEPEKKQ